MNVSNAEIEKNTAQNHTKTGVFRKHKKITKKISMQKNSPVL
jgi:hypothetical protein